MASTIAYPGQMIGSISTHTPGPGTHVYQSKIYASIAGPIVSAATTTATAATKATKNTTKPAISIGGFDQSSSKPSDDHEIVDSSSPASSSSSNKLPKVGSIVLGRVLRVQRLQLSVSIITVDPSYDTNNTPTTSNSNSASASASASNIVSDPNGQPKITLYTTMTNDELQPQAILRREDVRAYEKDKIIMNDSFRIGDILRAVVISLGDEKNYYISTAGNDYGVVVAKSVDGNDLVPVSWREMRDVVTGKGEARKVAKPV